MYTTYEILLIFLHGVFYFIIEWVTVKNSCVTYKNELLITPSLYLKEVVYRREIRKHCVRLRKGEFDIHG